jgi:predicted P-loop ATPase/GTPase
MYAASKGAVEHPNGALYAARCVELDLVVANDALMYMLSWTKDTLMAAARTLIPICAFRWT